jgi:hypothetical protein
MLVEHHFFKRSSFFVSFSDPRSDVLLAAWAMASLRAVSGRTLSSIPPVTASPITASVVSPAPISPPSFFSCSLSILLGRKNANPHKRLERVHRRRVGDPKEVVSTKRSTKQPNKHQAIKQIQSRTHETNQRQQKLLLVLREQKFPVYKKLLALA